MELCNNEIKSRVKFWLSLLCPPLSWLRWMVKKYKKIEKSWDKKSGYKKMKVKDIDKENSESFLRQLFKNGV
jgi:hypothetical protein